MKKALMFVAVLFSSCDMATNETTVGDSSATQVPNVVFVVDTTYLVTDPAAMVARGRATNIGTGSVATGWYVECQFYTDASLHTKLGGNNTRISVPLAPRQETFWTISFSSSPRTSSST